MRLAAVLVALCVPLASLAADARAGEQKAHLCLLCHKEAPDKRFVPLLEAQPADSFVAALVAYKSGQRYSPDMTTNAAGLSPTDMRDLAAYFASRPFPARNETVQPGKVATGEKVVAELNCARCHTAAFHGAGTTPRLAGQKLPYLVWQLEAIRGGRRTHPLGTSILKDGADVENVASYLSSLR